MIRYVCSFLFALGTPDEFIRWASNHVVRTG
jgi:hypothetical protein